MAVTTSAASAENNASIMSVWFSFQGRASRSTYWLKFFLPWFGIFLVAGIIDAIAGFGAFSNPEAYEVTPPIFGMIAAIFSIWPSLAVVVKRLHDRGHSGWYLLLALIPFVNIWVMIQVYFLRGTIGANDYGSDPVVE